MRDIEIDVVSPRIFSSIFVKGEVDGIISFISAIVVRKDY